MGRLMGRRPDPTLAIARAARRHLGPGEHVLAAIYAQRPGTLRAGLSGGASGAVGATAGLPPRLPDDEDQGPWLRDAAQIGLDDAMARRTIWLAIALTQSRLLLLRRSRLTRRPREVIAVWPLRDVDRIDVPRNGSVLTIHRAGAALRLDLPQAHRFLPEVYRDLPTRLAHAQAEQTRQRGSAD
jgi:hypothetical protein